VQALCYNPTDDKVYCANSGSNTVTVIDGATDSVIATVPAPAWAFCYNPTNDKIYCGGAHTVTVIDGVTDSIIAQRTRMCIVLLLQFDQQQGLLRGLGLFLRARDRWRDQQP